MIPVIISAMAAIFACQLYFSIIFMEGGIGKNGSTVAVSVTGPVNVFYTSH